MSSDVHALVDPDERSATITTRFSQPVEVVWTLWSSPEKLARWLGPPGLPMTIDHHDLTPGGRVEVSVDTGSTVIRGRWSVLHVDPPRSLRFAFSSDGLSPTDIDVRIDPSSPGTTMTIVARFSSESELRHGLEIGVVDGLTRACGSAPAAL